MDYEAVRVALGLAEGAAEWAAIKSAGRQSVARAFREGGQRKAKLRLEKIMAVISNPHASAETTQSQKKQRRRANKRSRDEANQCGTLTDGQLYSLFASQHDNWARLRALMDDRRVQRSKERRRKGWAAEYAQFCMQFAEHYNQGNASCSTFEGGAPPLFVATVAQAALQPPNEEMAERLWDVLSVKRLAGMRLGSVAEVPIGGENVGRRMLLALGWQPGTSLGASGAGIVEPIVVSAVPRKAAAQRLGLGFHALQSHRFPRAAS